MSEARREKVSWQQSQHSVLLYDWIDQSKLITVENVMAKYSNMRGKSKAERLACKVAKEALFDPDVMKLCTPIGSRDKPGLPAKKFGEATVTQFPQYWKNPIEFEGTWKKCVEAVQQCCKRLGKEK